MALAADANEPAVAVEKPQPGRLRRRLLQWFLIFSLLPLIVTNAVGYRRSEAIIEQMVERYVSALAEVQAQHIRDRSDRGLLLLDAITAGNEFLVAGVRRAQGIGTGAMTNVADRRAMEGLLQRKLEDLTGFDGLYLFTPNGKVVASAGRVTVVNTRPPRSARGTGLTATTAGGPWGERPEFRLVSPLLGRDRKPVAYLAGAMSVDGFRAMLQLPEQVAGHVESFIVDSYGKPLFISHPHGEVHYGSPLAIPLLKMTIGAHAQYRDTEGRLVLGTTASVPDYPWRFVVEVPADEAFAALRRLGRLSLVLEVLFVTLLFGVAWVVARDVVAPISRLVRATRRVGDGDLAARVTVTGRDEIGELEHAFNDMTAALADTTDRVRELHLQEIERASQLATVGELASGIAHEIKNPVMGVSNGLDLIRRRIGTDAALSPIIDEMGRQLARIQTAMQELLSFARPATPTLAPVNASHLVGRAIRLAQPSADRAGVRIEVRLDPTVPRFQADEDMLYQALVNLLMNAIEATSSGGHVAVTTRATEAEILFEVADTGRGISPADLESVFKPFFTTRHLGTGLGLSITRQIVERHGGTVTIESREHVGTTVTMRIPVSPRPDDRTAAAEAE